MNPIIIQNFSTIKKAEFHGERTTGNLSTGTLDQLAAREGRASGGDQIIHKQNFVAR